MFYFLAAILIISAILTVSLKNLFHCALCLAVALLSLAGLYFYLDAPFVGVMQLIIYVGAIMILILFAIMLTTRISDRLISASNHQIIPAIVAILIFLFFVLTAIGQAVMPAKPGRMFEPIIGLGNALLTTYLLPFEVVSFLLLAALVGAVVIARRDD